MNKLPGKHDLLRGWSTCSKSVNDRKICRICRSVMSYGNLCFVAAAPHSHDGIRLLLQQLPGMHDFPSTCDILSS